MADHAEAIRSFCELTETNEEIARMYLERVDYRIEAAIEHYFQDPGLVPPAAVVAPAPQPAAPVAAAATPARQPATPVVTSARQTRSQARKSLQSPAAPSPNGVRGVKELFQRYANHPEDSQPDKIGPNGVSLLLEDLGLDAEDRKVLILAYKMGAEIMCEFSWAEWQKGMQDLGADTVASLRKRLDEIDQGLKKSNQFKPLYQFTFTYGKNAGQRNLELQTALVYWKILFKEDEFPLLPLWEEFMTSVFGKAVTKDTWNLLFDFLTSIAPDLSNYDEDGAWPVTLDNFVHWAREKQSEREKAQ